MQHVQNVVLMSVHSSQNILEDYVLRVGMIARRQTMCVKTDLQDHGTRLNALESKHNTPEDLAEALAELAMIKTYLFGAGGVPRDKSNVVKS